MPFVDDREVGEVEHVFADDAAVAVEEFRAELHSASFDARRSHLSRNSLPPGIVRQRVLVRYRKWVS